MKKYLKKIGIIIFILFAVLQNYCLADLIEVTTEDYIDFFVEVFLIPLTILLIVFIISFLNLRIICKREMVLDEADDKELFKKEKHKVKRRVYMFGIFLIITLFICLYIFSEFKYVGFFELIILLIFIVSIILKLNKKAKCSKAFFVIGIGLIIALIIISSILKLKYEKFNNNFLQYTQYQSGTMLDSGYRIEGNDNFKQMIEEIIKSNEKSKHKIAVIYTDDNIYTTQEELSALLDKEIDIIGVDFTYENYYITEIKFYAPYGSASTFNLQFTQYEGKCLGSSVRSLIDALISNASTNSDVAEKLPAVYFYSSDGTDDYNVVYDEDENDYTTDLSIIRTKIKNSHNYEVEMSYNNYGYVGEITITY